MIDSNSHHHQLVPEDYLDRLPDDLLLAIFSRVRDAADLVRLLSLCRRFSSLVPLVPSISLSFASPKLPALNPRQGRKARPSSSLVKSPFHFLYDRVFRRFLRRLVRSKQGSRGCVFLDREEDIVEAVGGRLRLFGEAREVRVSLPCEVSMAENDGTFLKWRASYGSKIRSCVILGASEVCRVGESLPTKEVVDAEDGAAVPALSDEELKLRVVWIISCLIAAAYRHNMMKKMIESSPAITKIVVGDERGQGKVGMGEEEVREARKEGTEEGRDEEEETEVPDLEMKLWHAPYLELPRCGRALKGATLVVITPIAGCGGREGDEMPEVGMEEDVKEGGGVGEEGVLVEAVRELRKRNTLYLLEMNSF